MTRLTNNPATDTSASYSPDGQKIVFNSNRSGRDQLHVMGRDGRNLHRISRGQGSYFTPVWDPRGDFIAFTRIHKEQSYIGVMRPDGSDERMLVKDRYVGGPSWAPNGRVISFFRQTPGGADGEVVSRAYTIDLTGYNERELITPVDASDPDWSPLIP